MALPCGWVSKIASLALVMILALIQNPVDAVIAAHKPSFSLTPASPVVENCGDPYTPVYQIQGSSATSTYVSQILSTEGIVVGDFQSNTYVNGTKNGFFIQDAYGDGDAATSDGLFIYSYMLDVKAGDYVRVRGKVVEYVSGNSSLTEIALPEQIWICSSGHSIAPTSLSLPVSAEFDYEAYEGMLITYPQPLVISEYFNFDRYGEIVLTSSRRLTPTAGFEPGSPEYLQAVQANQLDRIILDDGRSVWYADPALHPNGQVFDLENRFRGGDLLQDVTGILDSYESFYRIQPTKGATYIPTNLRPALPNLDRQNLLIASFNVLNYFTTLDMDGNQCGPLSDQNCRGADSEEEFARQRTKLLAALGSIQADVFGLVEIQNDQDQSAADLVSGLNDLLGSGTYAYIPTGFIGGDAIKVSLLYQPARVSPLGNFALLTSADDPRFVDTLNRPVLAQSFTDLANGKTFTVAVNHLKSKSSACPDDPDLGDGQGNCNLTRTAAAQALVDWLANDPTGNDVTDFLIMGDLNAYAKEDPIDAVKLGADDVAGSADDYIDLMDAFLDEPAYTYVFDGQLGYLDHALANRSLAGKVARVDVWHINADEPDLIDYNLEFKQPAQDALWAPDAYRASDHDPVIVSLNLDRTYLVMDDAYTTPVDTPLIVASPGVMSNDSQAYLGDALSVRLKTDVANGSLSLNPEGSFIYTPDPGFSGWVSFEYELLSSVHGVVGQATVILTMVEENIIYLPVVIG